MRMFGNSNVFIYFRFNSLVINLYKVCAKLWSQSLRADYLLPFHPLEAAIVLLEPHFF